LGLRETSSRIFTLRADALLEQLRLPGTIDALHEDLVPLVVWKDLLKEQIVIPGHEGVLPVEPSRRDGCQSAEVANPRMVRIKTAQDRVGVAHSTSPP
jgi:hypothetical protein